MKVERVQIGKWTSLDVPLIPIDGLDHGTIMSDPNDLLSELVIDALRVSSAEEFENWLQHAQARTSVTKKKLKEQKKEWQQFVVRVLDERGDPVPDYYIEILKGESEELEPFEVHVHVYSQDSSFRCFHVNLGELNWENEPNLKIRLIATSGSQLVSYFGYGTERVDLETQTPHNDGKWDAIIDIGKMLKEKGVRFFYPFTTTLIELRINREPMPLTGPTELFTIGPLKLGN